MIYIYLLVYLFIITLWRRISVMCNVFPRNLMFMRVTGVFKRYKQCNVCNVEM